MAALAVPLLSGIGAQRATAAGILPGANPQANRAPSPDFLASGACGGVPGAWHCANPCVTTWLTFPTFTVAPRCAVYVTIAIDKARAAEGVGPLVLPSNFESISVREQLFVLADLERTARGLPPYLGLDAALSAEAQHAARAGADPGPARGFAPGADPAGAQAVDGAWASAFSTLVADYLWMYADGWSGPGTTTFNGPCTTPRAPFCWAHRDELLGADWRLHAVVGLRCRDCEMGTGAAIVGGRASLVDLIERPAHRAPAMTFTWAHDVVPYLPATGLVAARERLRARVEARRATVHGTWPAWNAPGTAHPCRTPGAGRLAPQCRARTFTTGRHVVGAPDKEER